MQDKTGGDLNHFYDVVLDYMDALKARPEINSAQTTFNPNFPQYMLDIDAAACKKAGISPSDILTTMQGIFRVVCMLLTSTVSVRCIVL